MGICLKIRQSPPLHSFAAIIAVTNSHDLQASPSEAVLLSPGEADALLEAVSQQLDLDQFDPNDHRLLRQMVEALGDSRGMTRLSFAETLGEIGEPATPFLLHALSHHPNAVVRRAAGKTLTIISDPTAVPTLVQVLLHDEDTVVKGSVMGALARTGEAAVPALLNVLAASEYPESAKGHAAWALSFIGGQAAPYLYDAFNSDSVDVRCAVVGAMGAVVLENGDERAFNLLLSALRDPEALIRTEAAAALGKLNQPAALEGLYACLQDADLQVRQASVSSLGKLRCLDAIPHLEAALNDPAPSVQTLAKLAIHQIQNSQSED